MAIQTIKIGQYANDGSGDDLRTAFTKVNANFALLGTDIPVAQATNITITSVTATNVSKVGSGPWAVTFTFERVTTAPAINQYYYVTGSTAPGFNGHYFCTVSSVSTITLTYPTDPGAFVATTPTTIKSSVGIFASKVGNSINFNSIKSSDNSVDIIPNADGTIDIKAAGGVVNDKAPRLGGDLLLNGHIIRGANGTGDIQSTVYGIDVAVLNAVVGLLLQNNVLTFDLGVIVGNYSTIDLTMGFLNAPIQNGLDFGRL
jgi:hypothetical protein